MSRYRKVKEDKKQEPRVEDSKSINDTSMIMENAEYEHDVHNSFKGIKKLCIIMILTSPIIPALSWFIDPYHYVFYQFVAAFIVQIYVAILGIRAGNFNYYRRLVYFRKVVNIFYIYFLVSLVINEFVAVIVSSNHNYDDCGSFTNYKVCKNRNGMMTTQMVTIILSPFVDFSVFVFYKYTLLNIEKCKTTLTGRRI